MYTEKNTGLPIVADGNDSIIIDLDRPRELKLGHKALKRFSALTGCSMKDMEREISHYDKLACLMYVMLAVDAEKHGEQLTPEQVDELLEDMPVYQQMALVGRAIEMAFVDPSESTEATDDPTMAAGTGVRA